jgi:hypothetical protein
VPISDTKRGCDLNLGIQNGVNFFGCSNEQIRPAVLIVNGVVLGRAIRDQNVPDNIVLLVVHLLMLPNLLLVQIFSR